jgi:hypothetical protein
VGGWRSTESAKTQRVREERGSSDQKTRRERPCACTTPNAISGVFINAGSWWAALHQSLTIATKINAPNAFTPILLPLIIIIIIIVNTYMIVGSGRDLEHKSFLLLWNITDRKTNYSVRELSVTGRCCRKADASCRIKSARRVGRS